MNNYFELQYLDNILERSSNKNIQNTSNNINLNEEQLSENKNDKANIILNLLGTIVMIFIGFGVIWNIGNLSAINSLIFWNIL